MALYSSVCFRCQGVFGPEEKVLTSGDETWHPSCFMCSQCFRPFPDGIFFEYRGRKYCEEDFKVLYAPTCAKCNTFACGRLVHALGKTWHVDCFVCESCGIELADEGFERNEGRPLCRSCNEREKSERVGKLLCHKCHKVITPTELLRYQGECFHANHFNCTTCKAELTSTAKVYEKSLYCSRCYDYACENICAACRRPVEEQVVFALGKAWHPEHFACSECEKPFMHCPYWVHGDRAYCEVHHLALRGRICVRCNAVISGPSLKVFNHLYCLEHYTCSVCDKKLKVSAKILEADGKPVCKKCYRMLPLELQKRLGKYHKSHDDLLRSDTFSP